MEWLERELTLAGRNDAPIVLYDYFMEGDIEEEHLKECLLYVWSLAEYPEKILERKIWIEWFNITGFLCDMPGIEKPKEPILIYRGHDEACQVGMSWTTDINMAAWFANRLNMTDRPGYISNTTISPDYILAIIHEERKESEVVIDPSGINTIETLDNIQNIKSVINRRAKSSPRHQF